MIVRSFDETDGIIFVTGHGVWSPAEVDEHFRELGQVIHSLRRERQPVRILSDVTSAERQSAELEASILQYHEQLYESGDRIALLVAPSHKPHVVHLLGKADVATFNSRLAAEMWLMTPDLPKPLERLRSCNVAFDD